MTAPEHQAASVCAAKSCARPAAPGATICEPDVRRLGDWIAQLQAEYEMLSAAPSMQGRDTGTVGGTNLTSQRAPGNTHVMALRSRRRGTGRIGWEDADTWGLDDTPSVYETLTTYAQLVREARQLTGPRVDVTHVRTARPHGPVCDPQKPPCGHHTCEVWTFRANVAAPLTVATERKVLATHLDWILGQQWAGEFYDEIRGLWALLRRANGHAAPARKMHRLHAPCPTCHVRALTHRPGTAAVTCENCGHSQTVPELEASA